MSGSGNSGPDEVGIPGAAVSCLDGDPETRSKNVETSSEDCDRPTARRPAETFLRGDIELSAEYRREYYKYILTISTALLAFTISFQPTLRLPPQLTWLEFLGWAGLVTAVAAGVRIHLVWSRFYATTQKYLNKGLVAAAEAARQQCHRTRRQLEAIMVTGFVLGVAGVVSFTAFNLENVALKTGDETATGAPALTGEDAAGAQHARPALPAPTRRVSDPGRARP